jgi:hypothetical protein
MNITRTLMLAGFAALSLGLSSAMAQNLSPSSGEANYFQNQKNAPAASSGRTQVQSGSSDVERAPAVGHSLPFNSYDYGTLANPG